MYAVATLLTDWVFIGDAPDFARSSAAWLFGVNCQFLEFGHLAWRPVGAALLTLVDSPKTGDTFRSLSLDSLRNLGGASWTLGLLGVIGAAGWLRTILRSYSAAAFGVVMLIACKAYLNFAQVGMPYVPSLALLFMGLCIASLEPKSVVWRVIFDVVAGLCFAASALAWGTFAIALPGAVLAPLVLSANWRRRLPRVVLSGAVGVATLLVVYFVVGRSLGFHSVAEYMAWIAAADHGISTGGLPRAAIGLARSFVDVGDYGRLVKRFMVRDAYNPVPLRGLLTADLLKIGAFYLTMLAFLVASLHGTIGRRALAAASLIALPVLGFAILWQGGDLERYLPAMPGLVLLAAAGFLEARGSGVLRLTMMAGVAIFAVSNAAAMSNRTVQRENDRMVARLAGYADRGQASRLIVVSHWQDGLMTFHRNRPFHQQNLSNLTVFPLVTPGKPDVALWRSTAARRILRTWDEGRDVLLSSRLVADRPDESWNWVEGDDPRVSWREFHDFFRELDLEPASAGKAEFRILIPSARNRKILSEVASSTTSRPSRPSAQSDGSTGSAAGPCRVDGSLKIASR